MAQKSLFFQTDYWINGRYDINYKISSFKKDVHLVKDTQFLKIYSIDIMCN